MPDTIESIIDSFLHPTLTPIEGIPTFAIIRQLQLELNSNASLIHSNSGDSKLGLLYVAVSQTAYNDLSDVPFIPPINPGPFHNIPKGCSARDATDTHVQHTEEKHSLMNT